MAIVPPGLRIRRDSTPHYQSQNSHNISSIYILPSSAFIESDTPINTSYQSVESRPDDNSYLGAKEVKRTPMTRTERRKHVIKPLGG